MGGTFAMAAAAAVLLVTGLAGCADHTEDPPADPCRECDLHLFVSNQSFDQPTADIVVSLDGFPLFDGEAEVEDQHNWMASDWDAEPGSHTLSAREDDTRTRGSTSFSLPQGEERWIVVDYWNDEAEGPRFTFTVSDEPVAFD